MVSLQLNRASSLLLVIIFTLCLSFTFATSPQQESLVSHAASYYRHSGLSEWATNYQLLRSIKKSPVLQVAFVFVGPINDLGYWSPDIDCVCCSHFLTSRFLLLFLLLFSSSFLFLCRWSFAHNEGRVTTEKFFNGSVATHAFPSVSDDIQTSTAFFDELMKQRSWDLVVGTSYGFQYSMYPLTSLFPHTYFLHISGDLQYGNRMFV